MINNLNKGDEGYDSAEIACIAYLMKQPQWNTVGAEVIWTALEEMKANPKLSPSTAFRMGCYEWDV